MSVFNYYVDTDSGVDAPGGGGELAPLKTFQYLWDNIYSSDTASIGMVYASGNAVDPFDSSTKLNSKAVLFIVQDPDESRQYTLNLSHSSAVASYGYYGNFSGININVGAMSGTTTYIFYTDPAYTSFYDCNIELTVDHPTKDLFYSNTYEKPAVYNSTIKYASGCTTKNVVVIHRYNSVCLFQNVKFVDVRSDEFFEVYASYLENILFYNCYFDQGLLTVANPQATVNGQLSKITIILDSNYTFTSDFHIYNAYGSPKTGEADYINLVFNTNLLINNGCSYKIRAFKSGVTPLYDVTSFFIGKNIYCNINGGAGFELGTFFQDNPMQPSSTITVDQIESYVSTNAEFGHLKSGVLANDHGYYANVSCGWHQGIAASDPDHAAVADVRKDVVYANGTLVGLSDQALEAEVKKDSVYDNSTKTGTYEAVCTYAPLSDVRKDIVTGAGTGTAAIPTASQVLDGIDVDATEGNVTLPEVANVLDGVLYGPNDALEGTFECDFPLESNVKESIEYDNGNLTGTLGAIDSTQMDIAEQLRDKVNDLLVAELTDYEEMVYQIDPTKNDFYSNAKTYCVLIEDDEHTNQIIGTETISLRLRIKMTNDYVNKNDDLDARNAAKELIEQMELVRRTIFATRAGTYGSVSGIRNIIDWNREAPEYIDSNNIIVLEADFVINYKV